MKIHILVEIEAIPAVHGNRETAQKESLAAVKEALRVAWKSDLQNSRENTCLLADFISTIHENDCPPAPPANT